MALEAVQAQAGHLSIESTRVYLHLTNDWLAEEYRRAAALIDADTKAVAEMLAAQEPASPNERATRCDAYRRPRCGR
jgi:site-specific recombinase XerC